MFCREFGAVPYCQFVQEGCWYGVSCSGEGVVEDNQCDGAVVITEVQCFPQSVLSEPVAELPEGVCLWGEDDEGSDVMAAFFLERGDKVVDNLAFLEWDEHYVSDCFLGGVPFDEGSHALVDTFRHHFVCVFWIAVSCVVCE